MQLFFVDLSQVCEDFEKLDALEMHKCLGAGAQMLFGNKWRKLDLDTLPIPRFDENSCFVLWVEFFLSVTQVVCWVFS